MVQERSHKDIQKIFQIKIIIDFTAIASLLCEYFEQLYAIQFENLERHKLPKVTQVEINNLNSSIFIKQIE